MSDERLRYEQYHNRRMQKAHDDIDRLERERDEAVKSRNYERAAWDECDKERMRLRRERDEAVAERDALRAAMDDAIGFARMCENDLLHYVQDNRTMHELGQAKAYRAMMNKLRDNIAAMETTPAPQDDTAQAVAKLSTIVRMPNAEHVADAHNRAVAYLRETFGLDRPSTCPYCGTKLAQMDRTRCPYCRMELPGKD